MQAINFLTSMVHDLEKRLGEVERVCGAFTEMSVTMETAVQLLIERGHVSPEELSHRTSAALQTYGKRLGQAPEEALQRLWEAILDEQLESFNEAELVRA